MGLFFRKSLKVGPFRYNFSAGGIGVSVGIKGLRVGSGPRGNYVSMGRGGVFYRSSVPTSQSETAGLPLPPTMQPGSNLDQIPDGFEKIQSNLSMMASTATEILTQIKVARARTRLLPFVLIAGGMLTVLSLLISPMIFASAGGNGILAFAGLILSLLVLAATGFFGYWAHLRDEAVRTVVIGYELDNVAQARFERLIETTLGLQKAQRAMAITSQKSGLSAGEQKRNAGATAMITTSSARVRVGDAPNVKSNLAIPILEGGGQQLCFFPDWILVFTRSGMGGIAYKDLKVDVSSSKFIEGGSVPSDATVVGQTWKYVNKKGGPDKRFKDNRQLPILLLDSLVLSSSTGLDFRVDFSRQGIASELPTALKSMH